MRWPLPSYEVKLYFTKGLYASSRLTQTHEERSGYLSQNHHMTSVIHGQATSVTQQQCSTSAALKLCRTGWGRPCSL